MAAPDLRNDFDSVSLRRLADQGRDPEPSSAGVGRGLRWWQQDGCVADRRRRCRSFATGLRFNARGPDGLVDGKSPGAPSAPIAPRTGGGCSVPAVDGVVRWRRIALGDVRHLARRDHDRLRSARRATTRKTLKKNPLEDPGEAPERWRTIGQKNKLTRRLSVPRPSLLRREGERRRAGPRFPRPITADQFFDEEQFDVWPIESSAIESPTVGISVPVHLQRGQPRFPRPIHRRSVLRRGTVRGLSRARLSNRRTNDQAHRRR